MSMNLDCTSVYMFSNFIYINNYIKIEDNPAYCMECSHKGVTHNFFRCNFSDIKEDAHNIRADFVVNCIVCGYTPKFTYYISKGIIDFSFIYKKIKTIRL